MINKYDKSIAFVLPGVGINPVGGFKIIYEYANRIELRGYKVSVFYAVRMNDKSVIKNIYRFFVYFLFRKYSCKKWFKLNSSIKECLLYYSNKEILKYKNICLSAVTTAYSIQDFDIKTEKNNILYLIQDYEKWLSITDEYIQQSYSFPFKKIVISEWLRKRVQETGNDATLIYNGFDFDYFKLTNEIKDRNPYSVCMLYHLDERKRCEDTIKALEIVKQKFPDLIVNTFGVPERPSFLPDWYYYTQRPNKELHNKIYNDSAIYVAASKAEGMALPPAEAMICGCALVCTNIDGFAMYAINNETALTSPPFDYKALAENIIKLIENNDLRINIAEKGNEYIHQFTWENSVCKFENLLEE